MILRASRLLVLALCFAVWGCAHTAQRQFIAEAPSEEVRRDLGRIEVAWPATAPQIELRTSARGALGGAGRGAVLGAYYTIAGFASGGDGRGALLGLLLSPVGALVGTVYGAASADSAEVVEEQERSAREALEGFNVPGALQRLTFDEACRQTRHLLLLAGKEGSLIRDCPGISDPTAAVPADTSLRVEVERVDLVGPWTIRPKVALFIRASTALSRVADGQELDVRDFSFMSDLYEYSHWTADENRLLAKELERGCAALAVEIVERIFLLYPIP